MQAHVTKMLQLETQNTADFQISLIITFIAEQHVLDKDIYLKTTDINAVKAVLKLFQLSVQSTTSGNQH